MLFQVGLPLTLAFVMFSLGLGLRVRDFLRVITQPTAFTVGLINQIFLLPLVAFGLLTLFGVNGALAVGVMLLAASPGGSSSNVMTRLAGGNVALSVSLTAVISLLSMVTVPLVAFFAIQQFMGGDGFDLDITRISLAMFVLTFIPVSLGVIVASVFKERAALWEKRATFLAVILFFLIVVLALAANWALFLQTIGELGLLFVADDAGYAGPWLTVWPLGQGVPQGPDDDFNRKRHSKWHADHRGCGNNRHWGNGRGRRRAWSLCYPGRNLRRDNVCDWRRVYPLAAMG